MIILTLTPILSLQPSLGLGPDLVVHRATPGSVLGIFFFPSSSQGTMWQWEYSQLSLLMKHAFSSLSCIQTFLFSSDFHYFSSYASFKFSSVPKSLMLLIRSFFT